MTIAAASIRGLAVDNNALPLKHVTQKLLQNQIYKVVDTSRIYCWQYFTKLADVVLANKFPDADIHYNQFIYGNCKATGIGPYTTVHVDHSDVLGKLILRGWLQIQRIPSCIIIRGSAYEYDLPGITSYNFQICVSRIIYCHSQRRFKYYYYEWYIPEKFESVMNWDLLFYGPVSDYGNPVRPDW